MLLQKEIRTLTFRKEEFHVQYHFYLCEDSGEQFTTTELDDININQLHNQYREKHKIPFTDEIIEIRRQYDLTLQKMSDALGLGANIYRHYENGEIPNESNGNLIRLAENPKNFKQLVEESPHLDQSTKETISSKIDLIINERKRNHFKYCLASYLFGSFSPNELSGYRKPNLDKLTEMVVYFAEKLEPYKVKLNKLLFYADFFHYKNFSYSISGSRYIAHSYGPVPDNYETIFEYIAKNGNISVTTTEFPGGYTGEKYSALKPFDPDVFTSEEMATLEKVFDRFKDMSAKTIASISHEETGWIEHHEDNSLVPYHHAFDLRAM